MNSFPRRYVVNSDGLRVLIGLTQQETVEFETLDCSATLDERSDPIIWRDRSEAPAGAEKRWHELYIKHDGAWREWMVQLRAGQQDSPAE